MTGPERVLEGPLGFYELYAGDPDGAGRLREALGDLGTTWHLRDAAFKLIPCCHFIHPFVEAVADALDQGIDAGDVATIHCHVPRGAAPIIAEPWEARQQPATAHDARWSLPYVLAARVVDGHVGLELFDQPVGGARLDLSRRITHEIWDDSGFPAVFPARVTVTAHDGRSVDVTVPDVLGGGSRPVGRDAVVAKARANLAAAGWDDEQADDLVWELLDRPHPDVRVIGRLLAH